MDERAKQILGRRVEETRRDLGISKVDFCVATGISRPYLDRIEDGTANFTVKVWVEKVDRDRKKISLTMVQGK